MTDGSQPTRPVLPNEMEKNLSIREFEQRIESLKIWIISQFTHVREVADISSEALEKALDLQASEIARRLEELNHAHKIAMENWARSLPREIFDAVVTDWNKWREQVNTDLALASQSALNNAGLDAKVDSLDKSRERLEGAIGTVRLLMLVPGVMALAALLIAILRLAGLVK